MPTVATIDGVKIQFYPNEHPPPHFHAVYAEYRALIRIDTMELWRKFAAKQTKARHRVGYGATGNLAGDLGRCNRE
jgi:Domain of unknown function (DUF4160)